MKTFSFISHQIKGKGRGKGMGFPTINLEIPNDFKTEYGIYAALAIVNGKKFKGALHYGPIPTFGEIKQSLEIYIIDFPASEGEVLCARKKAISVEIIERIREVMNFTTKEKLINQIKEDVITAGKILDSKL